MNGITQYPDLFTDAELDATGLQLSHQASIEPFRFIDLFAGIGGFHAALQAVGGECVFASEKDAHARVTYTKNFDIAPDVFNDDIRKITPAEVPDHDVLCAGFPCQPFSQAGNKKGFEDSDNSERGNLFYCILDILEAKRPKAFILENVRHLIAHDEGKTLKTILQHLEAANYQVTYKVLKASEFNVPQHRPRVFFVGFDRSQIDASSTFHFPIPVPLTKSMSTIFNAPCDKKIGFTLRVGGKGSPIDDRRNYEFYLVNGEVRRIDLDEARELMSFPKTFEFPVSKTQAMKQLGNSVCVEVVKAVGKSTVQYLHKNTKIIPEIVQPEGNTVVQSNALSSINFIYAITSLRPTDVIEINQIQSNTKIKDRVAAVMARGGKFEFVQCENKNHELCLRRMGVQMPEVLANKLLINCVDTPSSIRHRFGSLYKEGNQIQFKLNLQLRLASQNN